jgi:DNA-binding NarL/FixJ family response regulator
MTVAPLSVLLAGGPPLLRSGLGGALERTADLAPAGAPAELDEAEAIAAERRPDVIVLSATPSEPDVHDLTRRLVSAAPGAQVVVLTVRPDIAGALAAVRAGARGCVPIDAAEDEVVHAIRAVGRGQAAFGGALADGVLEHLASAPAALAEPFPQLSRREREVLDQLARGASSGEIARRLGLSPKTVRNNVASINNKLAVVDRTQAALRARERGYGAS